MKTWKILNSENEVLTFIVNDNIYSLYLDYGDADKIKLFEAIDTENGFEFEASLEHNVDYSTLDYLRLFLNLVEKVDKGIYDSYMILEPIGQI